MQLVPGPIPTITSDWLDTNDSTTVFSDLAASELDGLPDLEQQMDTWLDPAAQVLDDLPVDGGDSQLDVADLAFNDFASNDFSPDVAAGDTNLNLSGEALLNVYAITPGEAFQPVPSPGDYGGTPAQVNVIGTLSATFNNLSRPGATDFIELENYEIVIVAPPVPGGVGTFAGVPIVQYRWFNDQQLDSVEMGVTDAQGFIHYRSTFPLGSAGNWKATFGGMVSDGTIIDTPDVFWTVAPSTTFVSQRTPPSTAPVLTGSPQFAATLLSPGAARPGLVPTPQTAAAPIATPAPLYPVTVTFTNDTTGDAHTLHVGDRWTLRITGPPGEPVVVAGNGPTGILSPYLLGLTDATGKFAVPGLVDASSIGTWRETYTVGPLAWPASLDFTVYA